MAGVGQYMFIYIIIIGDGCLDEASQVFEVYVLLIVMFEDFDSCCFNDGFVILGSGFFYGGIYFGDGVFDNSNGINFEFDL